MAANVAFKETHVTILALILTALRSTRASGALSTSYTYDTTVEVGSYADRSSRAMTVFGPTQTYNMEECVAKCGSIGATYAAMQGFIYCSCATDFDKVSQYGTTTCGSKNNAICDCAPIGEMYCNYVVQVKSPPLAFASPALPEPGVNFTVVGSFADKAIRAMTMFGPASGYSMEQCVAKRGSRIV